MKFPRTYALQEIAKLIDVEFVGDADFPVLGMNEIHVVEEGDIVFVDHPKYYDKALQSKATVVLINKKVDCPEGKALLISDNPFSDFNKISTHFNSFQPATQSISASAKIGEGTIIQPNVFVGNNVQIGNNCLIHSNVSIYDGVSIGNNVTLHSGTVLGANAFYYKKRETHFERLESCGSIAIEDDVEIGALCSIDKGVTGITRIKKGTKIDNQVQIGHDCVIGECCLIASHVGIAGCTILEDEVTLWGQVGVTSGITLAKGTTLLAQSGINKNTEPNETYFGSPAGKMREKFKEVAAITQLPKLIQKLKNNA
ncbi:UDP-3-O-(3-hydroxymyristoyl)glucosamine N-acyltransferase [Psychroflexus planctonicus]|uniref:UDP-3-O-(3-hydroxymyristoyl)glucosamine N-acyltransferase n=1 Tax=Psychroflexus planctonicus TaxID=1526575 RepID=A0ABQ1SEP6_9FLAO|nr:UDP-3-O-(3-hydroxymyristoyl)glucosamine N-acyltransferase [Psychroflexus planctonicus]GGE27893.1 UDP-3-O-(3-hydroxymyristoyl)glucosamine N-acyltransferase [Psychroflexus planctonicus]